MKNTKVIAVTGVGVALFVVLSLCLQVPVFENYYLCLGYVVMAVYCYSVSTISGTFIGVLGTVLYCFLINGLRGMPGWALGNVIIGLTMGSTFKLSKSLKRSSVAVLISVIGIVVGTAIGILGVKSIVEWLLYAQPVIVRVMSNTSAFIADVVVLLVSLPICKFLNSQVMKVSI